MEPNTCKSFISPFTKKQQFLINDTAKFQTQRYTFFLERQVVKVTKRAVMFFQVPERILLKIFF